VVAITTALSHNQALCSDGTLVAWGGNGSGQVGDNTTSQRPVPVAVNVEAGISALAGRRVSGLSRSGLSLHNMVIYGQDAFSLIEVTGNGADISQGDATPNSTDHTDFGTAALVHARVPRTFTITNSGNEPLKLSGTPLISLSGPGADAFEVTLSPANTVPVDGSTRFAITFDPRLPGLHTATVTIHSDAINHPGFSFQISGFGVLGTLLKQTISFSPPATVYIGQSPLNLTAHSSSGLPVTLSVVPAGSTAAGASIAGNVLSFTGTGTVKVQAAQAGDAFYGTAPVVVKTITIKASPAALTLLNLAQTYTGTPRTISTIGGMGEVTVEYKVGTAFGSTAPVNAGSYAVRATDRKVTKTGTLVISKAPLFVTPDDKRRFVGQDNPSLTLKYSGWIHHDTAALVTTPPVLKTSATKTSPGGVYPITASGGAALADYAFIYQQGALMVESFAASYEALLTDSGDQLVGKLSIIVLASSFNFTGKLNCHDEKAALSLKGALASNPGNESATGSASATSGSIPYFVTVTTATDGSLTATVTRNGSAYASGTGRRLLTPVTGKSVAYSGSHTVVLEPATPADTGIPRGAGWASAAISAKGEITLAGRLGDGTPFTSALTVDDSSNPVGRLFVQPYKTGVALRTQSSLGGAFTLLPHPSSSPSLAGRRYVEGAAMTWTKAGVVTDEPCRAGFGPVSTVLMLDPWLPPAAARPGYLAIPLAQRLDLTNNSFAVQHSDTGSTLNSSLPSRVSLHSANAVTVTTPVANTTKWKTKLVLATGLFTGSFELADTPPKPRVVNFTGILRQPVTAEDNLIGDGHYLLPPPTGTEKTTGEIMFLRP
jgi:hypothetical protein